MPVGDILQVRIECQLGAQASENIRHYRVSSITAPEATLAQIATNLDSSLHALYKSILSASATYRGVGVRRILPTPISLESTTIANLGVGSTAGDFLPKQTCGVLTFRTAFAGRAFRGRIYLPFPGETDSTAVAVPSNAYKTAADLIGTALVLQRTVANGAGNSVIDPVIYHKRFRTSDNITAFVTRGIWGTQRRRGDYGRPNTATIV